MAEYSSDDVAIVSMGLRVPGASNTQEFWRLLIDRKCVQEKITPARGEVWQYQSNAAKCRGILQNDSSFDAAFFGITPKEASFIDPQQRIFLEVAWDTLYRAGYTLENSPQNVGVYAATAPSTYLPNNLTPLQNLFSEGNFLHCAIGNGSDYLAARVAYKCNLHGPAITVCGDHAASAAAIVQAYTAIIQGECELALAGGVHLQTPQQTSCQHLRPPQHEWDAQHHPFEARAQGATLGSAAGVVALKRLDKALADGDCIFATLRGAAIATGATASVPCDRAGQQAVGMALAMADLDAEHIDYIEAQGSGFPESDRNELLLLERAYGLKQSPLGVGSHSANTGLLGVASGVIGVIKNALMLKNRVTPAMPGHEQDVAESSLITMNRDNLPWRASGAKRRVALNNYGTHGTHVHIVMEEAPLAPATQDVSPSYLWMLSAKSAAALQAQAVALSKGLTSATDISASDVAYTLRETRPAMNYRASLACASLSDGIQSLRQLTERDAICLDTPADVVFLFPGQGSQLPGMAHQLYCREPVFAETLDACADYLQPLLKQDIRKRVFEDALRDAALIKETSVTQPVLFAFEMALAKLWMHWGVKPVAMMGHSLGEYVAACLAGLFSMRDGCELVFHRGRLMQAQPRGAMTALRIDATAASELLAGTDVVIAGYNGPQNTVVAASFDAMAEFEQQLETQKIDYRRLPTSHAFHSPMMAGALDEFREVLGKCPLVKPAQRWVSCLTGDWIDPQKVCSEDYWLQQLANPVRFSEGIQRLSQNRDWCFLEVGPGRAMSGLVRQHIERANVALPVITSLSSEPDEDLVAIAAAQGKLWQAGVALNWATIVKNSPGRMAPLAGYAFEPQNCWLEPNTSHQQQPEVETDSPRQSASEHENKDVPAQVLNLLAHISGYDVAQLQPHKKLLEQGFDSLLLAQLRSAVKKRFKVPVTLRELMERFATPESLAQHIETAQPTQPDEVSGDSTVRKLVKKTSDDWLELTPAQRELAAVVRMGDAGSAAYNQCLVLDVSHGVQQAYLLQALHEVYQRHDALKTRFNKDCTQQSYDRTAKLSVQDVDLTGYRSTEAIAIAEKLSQEQFIKPFNLKDGPIARVLLLHFSDDHIRLVFASHHIVYDGWSSRLFFMELAECYNARLDGRSPSLQSVRSFAEHIALEQGYRDSDAYRNARHYWQSVFQKVPAPLELPTDYPRPAIKTYNSDRAVHTIALNSARIAEVAARYETTTVAFLLTCFQLLLARLGNQQDVVVGLPISVRDPEMANGQMGHATNLLPMRLRFDNEETFTALLQRNRGALLDAQDHQLLTFGELLNHLDIDWSPDRTPLVTTMFNVDRGRASPRFNGCTAQLHMPARKHANFEIEMQVVDLAESLQLEVTFNRDLFSAETLSHWLQSYEVMVRHLLDATDTQAGQIPLLSESQHRLLQKWNHTRIEYPASQRLESLIWRQCEKTPQALALSCQGKPLTYQQLQHRSHILSRALLQRGVCAGDFVGICLDRTPDMVAAALAVLGCGAAFVPLDPMFPRERLAYIIENSQLALVISTDALKDIHGCDAQHTLDVDTVKETGVREAGSGQALLPTLTENTAASIAYVLYTSGSTGKPKGVCISHRAIVNFLSSMAREPGLQSSDKLLAVTTLSFDISQLELFLPLLLGAHIYLASNREIRDANKLMALLENENISVMQATPATWRMLIDAGWSGSNRLKVLCGGEALPPSLAQDLLPRCKQLWNLYGPTETTVWSTCTLIHPDRRPTLGKPIANTTVWVLDKNRQPCPPGMLGELYIGGDGVALGYHRRPELTAERFVADPFSAGPGARLYNTGDLGRWLWNGELEFMGRNDFQIKIRGFRIELGEIEKVIQQHPWVHEAVVHPQTAPSGEQVLVAYLIAAGEGDLPLAALQDFLAERLSSYMLPSQYLVLQRYPLTPNAKVDRNALPKPEFSIQSPAKSASKPKNDIEVKIAELFAARLGLPFVASNEDFFKVGGNSILATALINDINDTFALNLQVGQLFRHPTITGLAGLVEQGGGTLKNLVVALNKNADKPAIYFVCGIALYHTLATQLGDHFSCYGVFVPEEEALFRGEDDTVSIERLASLYIRAIREHQPTGSFALAGVSFGGLLAFEMARQLDQSVSSLVLLDTILPGSFHRNWLATVRRMVTIGPQKLLGRTKVHQEAGKMARDNRNLQLWKALRGKGARAYLGASPACEVPALLVRATERPGVDHFRFEHDLGWRAHITENLSVAAVAGDHLGILESEQTAQIIRSFCSIH